MRVADINGWLENHDQRGLGSVRTNEAAVGGSKRMETPLYAGGFDYLDLSGFLGFLRTVARSRPDEVQVFVRVPNEFCWRIIDG